MIFCIVGFKGLKVHLSVLLPKLRIDEIQTSSSSCLIGPMIDAISRLIRSNGLRQKHYSK